MATRKGTKATEGTEGTPAGDTVTWMSGVEEIALDDIQPGANARTNFDADGLNALAQSIMDHGLMQPLVVAMRIGQKPNYSIVAGERRWRAARIAGLTSVPCRVVHPTEVQTVELGLVENLLRADLDPIEEASGFRALADLGMSQSAIAARLGRSQPSVANALRLLKLPAATQSLIRSGALTASHGVELLTMGEYPAAIDVAAAACVEHSATVQDIKRSRWEITDAMRKSGFACTPPWSAREVICKECPFGAHWHDMCLRPEHAQELIEEDRAAERARKEEQLGEQAVRELEYLRTQVGAASEIMDAAAALCDVIDERVFPAEIRSEIDVPFQLRAIATKLAGSGSLCRAFSDYVVKVWLEVHPDVAVDLATNSQVAESGQDEQDGQDGGEVATGIPIGTRLRHRKNGREYTVRQFGPKFATVVSNLLPDTVAEVEVATLLDRYEVIS